MRTQDSQNHNILNLPEPQRPQILTTITLDSIAWRFRAWVPEAETCAEGPADTNPRGTPLSLAGSSWPCLYTEGDNFSGGGLREDEPGLHTGSPGHTPDPGPAQ